jgi:hypothetical protein
MNSKKLIASVIALAIAGAIVAPGAQAATAEELAAQIAQLQSQLSGLMGQLGGTSSGTTASGVERTDIIACTGVTFSKNLTLGSSGNDVKCLQALLNTDDSTVVAATGVGSAGFETMTFGGLTKAAVIKFQNKYAAEVLTPVGLTAGTGFVGAATRAKLNAMLASGSVVVNPGATYPAGCTSATGYSATTGLSCATVSTLPTGCTSAAGYSPVTGQICSGTPGTGSGVTQTGAEGSITVSVNSVPANNGTLYEGSSKVAVYALKVKATGSDVDVQRMTLRFNAQPYSYMTNVYLYDGDTQLASSPLNTTTVSKVSGSDYEITLSGFASKEVVAKDTTKVLTVKVDVLPGISSGLLPVGGTQIQIGTTSDTAVRAVDQAGLNQYGGLTWASYRTFTIKPSQSSSATLTVSRNTSSPLSQNIVADSDGNITNATLLVFDLKTTKDDINISDIKNVTFSDIDPSTVYLVDDAGGISTGTETGTGTKVFNFTDLDYTIAAGTTKTFSIKIDQNDLAAATTTTVTLTGNGVNVIATKSNGGILTTPTGSAASNIAYLLVTGPELTLTGITNQTYANKTEFASSTVQATFNVSVTAKGGDIYIPTTNAFDVLANNTGSVLTGSTYSKPSGADNFTAAAGATGAYYKVAQDTTATFAISASKLGASGSVYLNMSNVDWATVATDGITATLHTSSFMVGDWLGANQSVQ